MALITADKIVENVIKENRIFEFFKMWRQHFLEHAKPKFLPKHWSLDHPLEESGK